MEDNSDFEKYEGYKDSAETLLGTNEKSSSMSSRERVDDAVEEAGAEFLSKYGVPKELGKKVMVGNYHQLIMELISLLKITQEIKLLKD